MKDHLSTFELGFLWLQSRGQRVWSGGPFWVLILGSFLLSLPHPSHTQCGRFHFLDVTSLFFVPSQSLVWVPIVSPNWSYHFHSRSLQSPLPAVAPGILLKCTFDCATPLLGTLGCSTVPCGWGPTLPSVQALHLLVFVISPSPHHLLPLMGPPG